MDLNDLENYILCIFIKIVDTWAIEQIDKYLKLDNIPIFCFQDSIFTFYPSWYQLFITILQHTIFIGFPLLKD